MTHLTHRQVWEARTRHRRAVLNLLLLQALVLAGVLLAWHHASLRPQWPGPPPTWLWAHGATVSVAMVASAIAGVAINVVRADDTIVKQQQAFDKAFVYDLLHLPDKLVVGAEFVTLSDRGRRYVVRLVSHAPGGQWTVHVSDYPHTDADVTGADDTTPFTMRVSKIHLGMSKRLNSDRDFSGHALLLEGADGCIFVGDRIVRFRTDGPIRAFHSELGNNTVPYACARTDRTLYFFDGVPVQVPWLALPEVNGDLRNAYTVWYSSDGTRLTGARPMV